MYFYKTARPSPPKNCTVTSSNNSTWLEDSKEETEDFLIVRCVTGYDGGLPQLVVLEAVDSDSGTVRFNVTANETGKLMLPILNATRSIFTKLSCL